MSESKYYPKGWHECCNCHGKFYTEQTPVRQCPYCQSLKFIDLHSQEIQNMLEYQKDIKTELEKAWEHLHVAHLMLEEKFLAYNLKENCHKCSPGGNNEI